MPSCPHCEHAVPEEARSCPACGGPAAPRSSLTTRGLPDGPGSQPSPPPGRFLPGQVLGRRYRIAGLVGRGGMGEVYRADDLKLGQPVALKLLPQELENDPRLLALLQQEVRISLRVTHPHVCRVYDLGEADGHHFLSMELVDGEDLASLLRRIGRLPRDRALRVARQLCAGLSAIHEQGIVHRDLKPANVLIDGRGSARITDFGLASIAVGAGSRAGCSGTPAYMAPELLAGEEATGRSDIYALGLVLYELFTGHAAFAGRSIQGLRQLHESSLPPSPSSLVDGLDPLVEGAILRCMEEDPMERPSSARAVAASLPGGDPLAAALAAGEVPSPAMVAEGGRRAGLTPGAALGLGGLIAAGLLLAVPLAGKSQVTRIIPLPYSPLVLENKGHGLLTSLGHAVEGDAAGGFEIDMAALRGWPGEPGAGRPDPIRFWYRVSPSPLVPVLERRNHAAPADPPGNRPGMATLRLAPDGRLISLRLVPDSPAMARQQEGPPDWSLLFQAAGLDIATARPVPPRHPPGVAADSLAAWEIPRAGGSRAQVVEAAALGAQPVAFHMDGVDDTAGEPAWPWALASSGIEAAWYLAALVLGALLARRNLRRGHGDRRGALRLALAVLAARLLSWMFAAHHVSDPRELDLFIGATAWAVYSAVLLWVLYMAIEPFFRTLWPRQMTSWVRLMEGRLRDPLVGRDLLIGLAIGVTMALNTDLYHLVPRWLGFAAPGLDGLGQLDGEVRALSGGRHLVSLILDKLLLSLRNCFMGATLLVLLRLATRRRAVAVGLWLVMGMLLFNPMTGPVAWDLAVTLAQVSLFTVALLRFGFLCAAAATATLYLMLSFPLTLRLWDWYAEGAMLLMGLLLAVTVWAMITAVGNRPWFELVPGPAERPRA